jgi:hypothetical protein
LPVSLKARIFKNSFSDPFRFYRYWATNASAELSWTDPRTEFVLRVYYIFIVKPMVTPCSKVFLDNIMVARLVKELPVVREPEVSLSC